MLPMLAASAQAAQGVTPAAIKAAFLLNFAKFSGWPADASTGPLMMCVVGDDEVAQALGETVKGQTVNGRPLTVRSATLDVSLRSCQILYIGEAPAPRVAETLTALEAAPVLTVSDAHRFASRGGMIEVYLDDDRMRFAINVDAAHRAGLQLNARLLALARIVRRTDAR
jgi:hypothetical protein